MNRREIKARIARGGAGLRILLIRGSSLGDIVHALPASLSLRQQLPHAEITWLAHRPYLSLIQALAPVDLILPFEREALRLRSFWRLRRSLFRFLSTLRHKRYHIVLDIQGLARTAAMTWLSGAPLRIGRAEARETTLLYTHRVRPPKPKPHPIVGACTLLGALHLDPSVPQETPRIRGADQALPRLLSSGLEPGAIALAPGSRWDSKTWPEESWITLARALRESGAPILILGGPGEATLGQRIAEACGGRSLAGDTDLVDLAIVLNSAALVIAGDSGPLHLAAVLDRPVIGLYGPTEWRRTYPRGPHIVALRAKLNCLACRHRRCPLIHHPCMRELAPEAIAAIALRVLTRS